MEATVKTREMHAASEEEKPLWGCSHGRDGEGEYSPQEGHTDLSH